MAKSNQSFSRRERERAKKEKANEKRARRLAKPDADAADEDVEAPPVEARDEGEVLRKLAELNAAFEAGDLDFDTFDEQRQELLASLTIE